LDCRLVARALLAPAVVAAAFALAGCDQDSIPTGRALAPLSEKMVADIETKRMDKESPILVRLFKEEAELEVWKKNRDGEFALLKTYPICRWSGDLGPKKKEGDRQAPEGFYTITPGQMNPNSNYYLAFNTGFPNAYDRAWGYTGSELMVHGDCSSRGCYAMTDEQIQEIYALARESFFGGQKEFQFEAFPFRMTALNMAKHRNNPNFAFWKMIKEGYDHFEATHQEPKVAVCERHYVFDPTAPDGATKPLRFDPRGKCPAYQLDKTVADVVLDRQRQEQFQMAKYVAENVPVAPPHVGDGGMNPVFAGKLASHGVFDNDGRTLEVAGNSQAPGALPHVPNPPGALAALRPPKPAPKATPVAIASAQPAGEPATLTSVPVPPPAPLPKEGEAPAKRATTIAGLLGNLFGGSKAVAQPAAAEPESEPVALRGSEETVKPQAAVVRTATAPAPVVPRAKPQPAPKAVAAAPKPQPAPKGVASAPAPRPQVAQAEKAEKAETQGANPAREIRTAYSASSQPRGDNGLLAGAAPVVPVGTFDSRWSALR
jgi:murein L,D-transpeptidase YafK